MLSSQQMHQPQLSQMAQPQLVLLKKLLLQLLHLLRLTRLQLPMMRMSLNLFQRLPGSCLPRYGCTTPAGAPLAEMAEQVHAMSLFLVHVPN